MIVGWTRWPPPSLRSAPHGRRAQAAARGHVREGRRADPLRQLRLCHRPGEVAPFSLLSFKDARPWARSIKQRWSSAPCRRGTPTRTSASSATRASLSDARDRDDRRPGSMAARRKAIPPNCRRRRRFTDGWQIGTPDLVLTMAEPVKIPATRHDPVRDRIPPTYVFPAGHLGPGDRNPPGQPPRRASRGRAGRPAGRENGAGRRAERAPVFAGPRGDGLARGLRQVLPEGHALLVPDALQRDRARDDRSVARSGFKFATAPVHTQVNTTIVLEQHAARPADGAEARGDRRRSSSRPTRASTALRPHMHLRAQLGTASLIQPGRLPHACCCTFRDWDDAWQNYYVLSQPGARGEGHRSSSTSPATTTRRPIRSTPIRRPPVPWGQQVWDEMHSVYMTWTAVNDQNQRRRRADSDSAGPTVHSHRDRAPVGRAGVVPPTGSGSC